jgi:hypothetical protein
MSTFARGAAIAAVLAGAWRRTPPPLHLAPDALTAAGPLLATGGTGGLAWHRLRHTALAATPAARELRQHYRLQVLASVDRDGALTELLRRLRAAGVEPILIKGWSAARLYPEPGLRPSADVDLCVAADHLDDAAAALSAAALPCTVDLHADVPDLPERPWDEIYRRTLLLPLGDEVVRVLGPEDQLRLLCLHLTRHGIARPLWLCDIGACLESLPAAFDWNYCLMGEPHLAAWMTCVLGLAEQLLEARPINRPPSPGHVPVWIERAVRWCWGAGATTPVHRYLHNPAEVMRRLRYHGLSPRHGSTPIKAALHLGLGPSRRLPLLFVQLAGFVHRKVPHVWQRLVRPRRRVALPFIIHQH